MKAELKRLFITEDNINPCYPEDPEHFGAVVDMGIGLEGSNGADIFYLSVCTPRWFKENVMTSCPSDPTHETVQRTAFGRHYLFVHSYDEGEIRKAVEEIVDSAIGETWEEIGTRLSRFFSWEFEDYNDENARPRL